MRRLYVKLYLAFVGVVLACFVAAGAASHVLGGHLETLRFLEPWAELFLDGLPPPSDPGYEDAVSVRAKRLSLEVALWGPDGDLLLHTGGAEPPHRAPRPGRFHFGAHPGFSVRLDDGRILGVRHLASRGHSRFLWALGVFAAVAALGCYPVARRITRRLERLEDGMDRFAAGDLGARAPVQGRDEVAAVAQSFNSAAGRIEALVAKERGVMAAASHELRSPLARVRVAVELLGGEEAVDRKRLSGEAARDIAQLDEVIEDLLLSARAQSGAPVRAMERLDLRALVASEARRIGAEVVGDETPMTGDRRMLARLLRNLLDNARRHGGGDVRVTVTTAGDAVRLAVEDRGPGVVEADRERIFEPFYRSAGHGEPDGSVGLGLSLVRQIAEYHQGRAVYEDRDGGGSRFLVTLAKDASRRAAP